MDDPPLVAGLMVTRPGREPLLDEAAADFRAQDWPRRALVVVHDGPADWHAALAARVGDGVVVARVERAGLALGALRNAAVGLARGLGAGYVIQWDDDDRCHESRVSAQVGAARAAGAVGSCLTSQLYYFADDRTVYWVDWHNRRPAYTSVLIPGTVCLRGDAAAACRYPESGPVARRGEDGEFLRQAAARGAVAEVPAPATLYVRRFHGANTWDRARFLSNARWLGMKAGWLRGDGRRRLLADEFNRRGYAAPGPVTVMGRDGPAYAIDVEARA